MRYWIYISTSSCKGVVSEIKKSIFIKIYTFQREEKKITFLFHSTLQTTKLSKTGNLSLWNTFCFTFIRHPVTELSSFKSRNNFEYFYCIYYLVLVIEALSLLCLDWPTPARHSYGGQCRKLNQRFFTSTTTDMRYFREGKKSSCDVTENSRCNFILYIGTLYGVLFLIVF